MAIFTPVLFRQQQTSQMHPGVSDQLGPPVSVYGVRDVSMCCVAHRANQEGYSPTSPHITFAVPEGDLPVTPMAIGAAALSISGDSPRLADVAEYRLAASLGATYSIAPAYRESAAGNKTFGKPGTLQIGQLGNILDHFVAAESPGPLIRPRQLQVHTHTHTCMGTLACTFQLAAELSQTSHAAP